MPLWVPFQTLWRGVTYVRPPASGGGGPPTDPDPGGGGPVPGTWLTLVETLFNVTRVFFNDQSGSVIANAGSGADGGWAGAPYLKQPGVSEHAQSALMLTGDRATFPGPVIPSPPWTVAFAYQRLSQAGEPWQNVLSWDHELAGASQPWGVAVSHTTGGSLRVAVRDADAANVVIETAPGLLTAGAVMRIMIVADSSGITLYVNDNTPRASSSMVIGGAPQSDLVVGRWRPNYDMSRLNALIGFLGVRSGPAPSPQQISDFMAGFRASVTHPNDDDAGEIVAGSTRAVSVTGNDIYSGTPVLTIERQPTLANATVSGETISIEAGTEAGSDDLDYKVNGSALPARVTFIVAVAEPPPPTGTGNELVFSAYSAQHQPIGSGASIADENHPETQALRAVQNKGWTYNRGGPWGVQTWVADPGWTQRTITWAAQNETNQAMAVNYPLTMKLPPPRTGSSITDWQPDNLPVKYPAGWTLGKSFDGVVCIFDDSTKMWRLFRQVVWQPFQSNVTANQTFVHSATGLGHPASPSAGRAGSSASGVFNMFGLLKGRHINQPGRAIPHGLQCIMSARAAPYILSRTFVPPAISTDGAANQPGRNLGPIPYGRRLTLPHGTVFTNTSFQVPGGPIVTLNEPTLRVAMAIFIYGLFPIDMDHPGIAIRTDQWISATVISQLLAHSGRIFPYLVPCLEVWQPNQLQCGAGAPRGPNYGYVP